MLDFLVNVLYFLKKYLVDYIDFEYSLWMTWILLPLIISFMLPLIIVLLLYMNALILYIYRIHRYRLRDAFEADIYDGARKLIAAIWDGHGIIWHGYEVKGIENVPENTPALFIYYHGAIPIDVYYFLSRVYLERNRLIHTVADRFLFNIPGWGIMADAFKIIPGTVQSCSAMLSENNLLAISPGGVYEAQFSDSYYRLMWKKRLGFARVALEAKVPIIPIFTQNVREAFRTVAFGRRIWLKLYSWTKFPFAPIFGGFPVKLTTHVGTPIPYDGSLSPEDLGSKVASALEELISTNQRIPGSITRSLWERVRKPASSAKTQ